MVVPLDQLPEHEFDLMTKMLIILLWEGGYPHEVICYMLNNYIEKGNKPWTPSQIVGKLAEDPLWKVCGKLQTELISNISIHEKIISAWFLKLDLEMHRKVQDILKKGDQTARKRWGPILNDLVGETRLKDYFSDDPGGNISDWSYRVLKRSLTYFHTGQWMERPLDDLCMEVKNAYIKRLEESG